MHLTLDIETPDLWLAFGLIGEGRSLGTGTVAPIPGRARVQLAEIRESRDGESPSVLRFVLSFRMGARASVIGAWLYEAIKGRAASVRIDGVSVPIRRGVLERVLAGRMLQVELSAVVAGRAA